MLLQTGIGVMLGYVTLLLACQLAGEVIAKSLALPIPGPVIGMVLLLVGLLIKGDVPDALERTARAFLDNLSLLFVPAGVGVMLHLALVEREWLPITASLIGSCVITIAVTALLLRLLARLGDTAEREGTDD